MPHFKKMMPDDKKFKEMEELILVLKNELRERSENEKREKKRLKEEFNEAQQTQLVQKIETSSSKYEEVKSSQKKSRIITRRETKNLAVENLATQKVAGVINTVNPIAWIAKSIEDVPVRYSEIFSFYPEGSGLKSVDFNVLQSDCHHHEIKYVINTPNEVKIEVTLYDWLDVWSTKATLEFLIIEEE